MSRSTISTFKEMRIWVLGAPDPEMKMIEAALIERDEMVVYATIGGVRVNSGNAYQADGTTNQPVDGRFVCVECDLTHIDVQTHIDHHRPGDAGFGKSPQQYMGASSLGQVLNLLHSGCMQCGGFCGACGPGCAQCSGYCAPTQEQRFCAAADHCLAAAYHGECPGVMADELMTWRIHIRAAFQGRSESEILADIDRARAELRHAPRKSTYAVCLNNCVEIEGGWSHTHPPSGWVADLRNREVPELPEAAAREGIAFLATPRGKSGEKRKVVIQCASPEQVRWFLRCFSAQDKYGDPARGFAGGYL